MKIMYLLTDLAMGGAEIQVIRMCRYMISQGNSVFYVSMMKSESSQMLDELNEIGCKFHSLDLSRGEMNVEAIRKILKIIRDEKPDVVHSHMIHANLLLRAISPFIRHIKKINTVHGEEDFLPKRKIIYKISDFLVDYTVCCGRVLYNQAKKGKIVSSKKLKYICNGLDMDVFRFDSEVRKSIRESYSIENKFVWITVGRLDEVKNQVYLIREFANVVKEYKYAVLMVVGDGPLKNILEELVEKLQIGNNVIFTGRRNDVTDLLSSSDAFVLSSIHEGLPLSLQEAASVGLPMVSTNVGGCNEVVIEGENGYLCESNRENALGDAMVRLMNIESREFEIMKKKSKTIVQKFDMKNVMKEWEKLYV